MNRLAILISYAVFILLTAIFTRRSGFPWPAAVIAGLFSTVFFILLFVALILPLYLLAGKLGFPDVPLLDSPLPRWVAGSIDGLWCVVGFFLSGRFARERRPPSSD